MHEVMCTLFCYSLKQKMAWFVQTRLFKFCNLLQRIWQFYFLLSLVFHCTLKLIGYNIGVFSIYLRIHKH
uniref:Uncharacterized protein n=1 Tax=Arundo donax TaxID=35708 RepID=A0A0A9E7H6_ARUDO